MAFDDLFQYVGGFGKFQLLHFFALSLPSFFLGYQSIAVTFLAPKDQIFWCVNDTESSDQCEVKINGSLNLPCEQWTYDMDEYGQTLISTYDLVCERSYLIQLSYMSFTISSIVTCAISGWFIDNYGRRKITIITAWLQLISAIAEIYAPTFIIFIVCRCFLFLFLGMCVSSSYLLTLEIMRARSRTLVAPLYWCSWSLGMVFLPIAAYFFRDLQILQMVLVAPMIPCVFYCFILEESPRWQVAMGNIEAAENTLTRMARMNKRTIPLDLSIEEETACEDSIFTTDDRKASICDLCRIPVLRREILLLLPMMCACNLIYYGLSFNTDSLPGSVYVTTFFIGLVEIPANFLAMVLMCKGGRRLTLGWSLILASLTSTVCSVTVAGEASNIVITIFAVGSKASITIAFTVLGLYAAELFPTTLRGQVFQLTGMVGSIAGLLAPFMGKPLETVWGPLPFLLYSTIGMFSGILVFFLPETLNSDLPETLEDATRLADSTGHILHYHKLDLDQVMPECYEDDLMQQPPTP